VTVIGASELVDLMAESSSHSSQGLLQPTMVVVLMMALARHAIPHIAFGLSATSGMPVPAEGM
jgi:hypothetical protein